jgi:DNA-binding CsgD family transcriptional regulator
MFSETADHDRTLLSNEDIRAILRLAGEAASMPFDHAARKSRLMQGLCEMVGATAWASALGRQARTRGKAVFAAFEQGGFNQEQFTRYLSALEHPDIKCLSASLVRGLAEPQTLVTRSSERKGWRLRKAETLWNEANLGPAIISLRPLGDNVISGIAIYRRPEAPAFSSRETCIVDLVLCEFSWLHNASWEKDAMAKVLKLYPRERVIFNLLLQGYGRKTISEHLGLSIHTVSGYVKSIYRHFGVQSHAALIRNFRTNASWNPDEDIPLDHFASRGVS